MSYTTLLGRSADSVVSLRNFSENATNGRQKKKLTPRTMTTITKIASMTSPRSPSRTRPQRSFRSRAARTSGSRR